VVAVERDSAEGAIMHPVREGLRDSLPADAANNARVMRRNFLDPATSFFRFVCKVVEKLSPSGVRDGLGKAVVLDHAFDI